jgi:ADP-ribose pyrophosphatase YjhB (NUDIX family)
MDKLRPKVGLGVIIKNKDGQILVMQRTGSHAPYWSIPGGHLELGESFEDGIVREAKEELDITIRNPKVIAVTNNLRTYEKEGLHYISVILLVDDFVGKPKNMEPNKCLAVQWVAPNRLPKPHFDASEMGVKCYLRAVPYIKT